MVKQVGSWILRETLGHGSFGEVYQAEHCETGRKVAVKVCGKQMLSKGQGRTLLQREIATMKALDHPSVLTLYEVLETTKRFYLVMELVERGELFDLIQDNKKFTEPIARRYFTQIIEGIQYCHTQGVVHRDLKPQNILLSSTDQIKLADFGFSRFQNINEEGKVSKSLRLQTQCGTPNYAAPEIFLGQGYDGFKTDIWSCGVILYVMLSGTVPFKPQGGNTGLQGVIMSIVQGQYTVPAHVTPSAADLLSIILTTDPEKRATLDDILAHRWLEREKVSFKIPKISVSDDEVRNSIVLTGDEVGFDAPSQGNRARGATFSSRPQAVVFDGPITIDKMLGTNQQGQGQPKASFETLASPVHADPSPRTSPISFANPPSPTPVESSKRNRKLRSATTLSKPVQDEPPPTPEPVTRTAHIFKRKHWHMPHWCFYCGKCIYGVGKQGFSCILCDCPVHVKCVDSSSQLSCCEQYLSRQAAQQKG
eukprot:TRINITY_DN16065_c0_g1_i1.p1 TRINITY_DN16065_c0_g1~~TRINITY_DN16065_c0_g1_i1.p1  ORF type:complete len:480 (+),score=42.16 TRINITY_DN16065_c0_g1_i1:70-1509(+)